MSLAGGAAAIVALAIPSPCRAAGPDETSVPSPKPEGPGVGTGSAPPPTVGRSERPRPAATDEAPAPRLVRLALSKSASTFLTEGRVRRLIDLELPSSTPLAADAVGPLDENAVRVFIDLPAAGLVTIQVQSPQRKLETRNVNVAGLAWDVAARVTAIATSESVLAQIAPVRKRPQRPKEPTPVEVDAALRRAPSLAVGGAAEAVYLPRLRGGLAGSRVSVAFHQPLLSEELSLSAMGGDGERGRIRYFEIGIGASHRIWVAPYLRMRLGGLAGLANLGMAKADPALGPRSSGPESSFTLRAAAKLSLEGRVAPETWLSIDIEPGAILLDTPSRAQGAWLGAVVGLSFDQPLTATTRKPD